MGSRSAQIVVSRGGVAGRAEIVGESSDRCLDGAVQRGHLLRPLPRTIVVPRLAADERACCSAALEYAGEGAALSHLTALRIWGLPVPEHDETHVLVEHRRRPRRGTPSCTLRDLSRPLRLHRSRHAPEHRVREGLNVVTLERAVVESWPLLSGDAARAPVLIAVRERRTQVKRLLGQLREHPRLRGRRDLYRLLDLVESGCHSELELWGHREVFAGWPFTGFARQHALRARGRNVYLDLFDEHAMLDLELDGRKYHSSPEQWERDIARDVAVAELGIQTIRFSHARLTQDPEGCRRQALTVHAQRLAQLGKSSR